jgi:flagellar hook-length control protein FliK
VGPNPPAVARDRPVLPPVATPVGHPGWDAEVGQRVVWMAGNSVSSAEIHLNPPHLGPVEVRISVNQDQQTSVQFLSPHAAVREALEAALPRLRDQFGAQQLNLGDVSVSQQSTGQHDHQQARGFQFQQQQQSSAWRGAEPEFPLGDGAGLAEEGERMRPVRVGQGLLNLYA